MKKLFKKNKTKGYFIKYFECLVYQEKFDVAEKAIIKANKKSTV